MTDLEKAAAAVAAGDSSAFRSIVQATHERFVRMSSRLLGSVAEGEDAVQEAYVRAHRALVAGRFDGRSRVVTWIHRIVINTTLDAKRARKRTPSAPEASPEPQHDGLAATEARLALRELAGWLGALPEEQQVALVLKTIEGLSSAEIAAILGCSEGAVEQRLVRARTTLREMGGHQ